jgi:hypothetical protein
MTNSVIEATTVGNGSLATPGEGERVLLLFARYSGSRTSRGGCKKKQP